MNLSQRIFNASKQGKLPKIFTISDVQKIVKKPDGSDYEKSSIHSALWMDAYLNHKPYIYTKKNSKDKVESYSYEQFK
ncbi:hypothetical protein FDB41_13820 [Clostridium botulinum]|nr:hypothetical protein [Clostridium botulinum]NFO54598.1 hypothetical protein [Clostridium botulinum]